jgi:hypothetical protein
MIDKPDEDKAVFVRALRDVGDIYVEGTDRRFEMKRGDVWVVRWRRGIDMSGIYTGQVKESPDFGRAERAEDSSGRPTTGCNVLVAKYRKNQKAVIPTECPATRYQSSHWIPGKFSLDTHHLSDATREILAK